MSPKKHHDTPNHDTIPDNWNNPFVGLKLNLPDPPKPTPPPPPHKAAPDKQELSPEDQALLKAFGGEQTIGHDTASTKPPSAGRGKISFNIQRKGKGGKTVTKVFGLQTLDLTEQMELCNAAKNALGCGARFLDGILEIQGDQRERAAKWLETRGFQCP